VLAGGSRLPVPKDPNSVPLDNDRPPSYREPTPPPPPPAAAVATLQNSASESESAAPESAALVSAPEAAPVSPAAELPPLSPATELPPPSPAAELPPLRNRTLPPVGSLLEPPSPFLARAPSLPVADNDEVTTGTFARGKSLAPGASENCYTEAPPNSFPIRGKGYLKDKKKFTPESTMFELVGVDNFTHADAVNNASALPGSVFQRVCRNYKRKGIERPRMLIVNWMVPGTPRKNHVQYYMEKHFEPINEDDRMYLKMLEHFFASSDDKSDAFRKKRFKMIPKVVAGPWLVQKNVNKPALVCQKLTTVFQRGEGYIEVAVDVASSAVARSVFKMCSGAAKNLVIDLAYTLEGKKEEELPERLLGGIRIHNLDMSAIHPLPSS